MMPRVALPPITITPYPWPKINSGPVFAVSETACIRTAAWSARPSAEIMVPRRKLRNRSALFEARPASSELAVMVASPAGGSGPGDGFLTTLRGATRGDSTENRLGTMLDESPLLGRTPAQLVPGVQRSGSTLADSGAVRTHPESQGKSQGNAPGSRGNAKTFQDGIRSKEPPKRIRLCPVCGTNPLPRGRSACSARCRKRKERILRQNREQSLLYDDR